MGSYDAVQDVQRALWRRAESGDPSSIVDAVISFARNDWEYWCRVAQELHRNGAHYDALDAWRMARQCLPNGENRRFDLHTMGRWLWHAYREESDPMLAESAAASFHEGQWWNEFLFVRQKMGCSGVSLLRLIEDALLTQSSHRLDCVDQEWELEGGIDNVLDYSQVQDWGLLAEGYLALGDLSGALRAWGRLVEVLGPNAVVKISIRGLMQEAKKRGVEFTDEEDCD